MNMFCVWLVGIMVHQTLDVSDIDQSLNCQGKG